jgi:prepilin-type N-terminal cleavage/methylation domain-containing protein
MRRHGRRSQGGFSLIEVVVALAIVSLMLGTIYQVSNGAVRSTVRTDNYLRALAMAQSRLAEASAMPVLKIGTVIGSADGVAWSRSVKPYAAPSPSPETRLYEVSVTATRSGSRVVLETLLIAGIARD